MHNSLRLRSAITYLQALPLTAVMASFLVAPLVIIFVVSFWDYTAYSVVPAFSFANYLDVLTSNVVLTIYLNTLKYTALATVISLLIGFWVAYYLVFHVRSFRNQVVLFLICTIPFWTSNIIRMISWIPLLGRYGLVNQVLEGLGIVNAPLENLLFSDFSVVLAFVHLYAPLVILPVFNSLARIDRSLIEAAVDSKASRFQVLWEVILPLSRTGIIIGVIFVATLVTGDFVTVRLMSGGQSASVGLMIFNQVSYLQYPLAAANAVILLGVVTLMIMGLLRLVDIRKEL